MPIETFYPQNPWESVQTKERTPWYYPTLYSEYKRRAIFNRFVNVQFNHNGPRATELVVTSQIMPHANHDPFPVRGLWGQASYMDTFERRIRFNRYVGKMSLNKYDDMVTYLQLNGVAGLKRVINGGLGHMMTHQMDKLARDAFFKAPFGLYGDGAGGWSGSDFSAIDENDVVNTELLQDVRLGLQERDVPIAVDEGGLGGDVVCVTSPGVMRDLRFEASQNGNSAAFIDVNKYSNPRAIINGEVGTYHGTRFVQTNNAVLYNAGTIHAQTTVTAPIEMGDGAPNPEDTAVDSVEYVGQRDATHYIQVNDVTGFNVGDIVTLHVDRTNDFGITNGLDYRDGKAMTLRIVAINSGDNQLTFERPVMEAFKSDLGGSVYGYVTKAQNIHTMTFLTARDGVVTGAAQPPMIYVPKPIDDFNMIYRITYDMYMGWQPFNKNAFEVVYLAGSNRVTGPRYVNKAA